MQLVHQSIFFCLVIAVISLNILAEIKLWHLISHHQFLAEIKKQAEEDSDLATIFSPHTVRIINTIIYTLAALLPLIVIVAIYFQGRYFNSYQFNHTTFTLILVQLVTVLFQSFAWPSHAFPNRRFSKLMLVTDTTLSLINYALLFYMLYQAVMAL